MQVISLKVPVSKQLLIALDPFDLLISYNLLGHSCSNGTRCGHSPTVFLLLPSPLPSSTQLELPELHTTSSVSIVRAWEHFIRLSNSFSFFHF